MLKSILIVTFFVIVNGCSVSPQVLTLEELQKGSRDRVKSLTKDEEPITGPVTLYEAMARAIKYNLDYKVQMLEEALRVSDAEIDRLGMLPDLVVSSGLNARDNFSGSRSSNILGSTDIGIASDSASTSTDRVVTDTNLNLSWDILDFGLSYVRAKQGADRVMIARERKRKVINRVIANVRTAYWKAISAERLVDHLRKFEKDISKALNSAEASYSERLTAPMAALTYQRELLEIQQQINQLEQELSLAKIQLAALMNVKPDSNFSLVVPERIASFASYNPQAEKLVEFALNNRPELRELTYEQRINNRETKAALLELLPGLSLFGGFNYNNNDFLYNNRWVNWGARASWNVLDAFKYPAKKRNVLINGKYLDQRALALSMSVITQVHVSISKFKIASRQLESVRKFSSVNSRIQKQILASYKAGKASYQNFVREHMEYIVSEAKLDFAFANLQNNYADIIASVGYDVYGRVDVSNMTVKQLSDYLLARWNKVEKNLSRVR